jgi:H+-transporting ATPase
VSIHRETGLTPVITRLAQERGTPNVFPSWQLIGAVLLVDILASIFALFGWISGPAVEHGGWVDIVTVVKIWLFSFGVTVVILCVCESSRVKSCPSVVKRSADSRPDAEQGLVA